MSNYEKMPKSLPLNDSLSSVSKIPQGASSIDHVVINKNACTDERHPAMSPLNPLTLSSFPKCSISTESNNEK